MRRTLITLIVAPSVLLWALASWAVTNLTVVRHTDNTLWSMTCDGTASCSSWTQLSRGKFSVQPTLTWDPSIQRYILIGIGNDQTSIWRSTFNADGMWNNDWAQITGASPSPVAVTAGSFSGVTTGTGPNPNAKIRMTIGDVAVLAQGNGLILRATDGANCYRITVNNMGALSTSPITCP
jgi:hypothetical protein